MDTKETYLLVSRYIFLFLIGVNGLYLIYLIFSPLTIYPSFLIFSYLYNASLHNGNTIFFNGYYAKIISSCIAGAAYYFLLILNLTTPMNLIKRVKSLIFLICSFLILNILRIVVFGILLTKGYQYFDVAHKMVWYFGSTFLVVILWFLNVWIFKIKNIPFYTDIKKISKEIMPK